RTFEPGNCVEHVFLLRRSRYRQWFPYDRRHDVPCADPVHCGRSDPNRLQVEARATNRSTYQLPDLNTSGIAHEVSLTARPVRRLSSAATAMRCAASPSGKAGLTG